jgi:hypothetical protein
MERQTFAKLLLLVLPRIVRLTAIKGFDGWQLRQVHRTPRYQSSCRD